MTIIFMIGMKRKMASLAWFSTRQFCIEKCNARFRAFSKRNRDHSKAYVAIDDHPANVQGGMDREWGGYFHIFD